MMANTANPIAIGILHHIVGVRLVAIFHGHLFDSPTDYGLVKIADTIGILNGKVR